LQPRDRAIIALVENIAAFAIIIDVRLIGIDAAADGGLEVGITVDSVEEGD
jgi:hypothetical protein